MIGGAEKRTCHCGQEVELEEDQTIHPSVHLSTPLEPSQRLSLPGQHATGSRKAVRLAWMLRHHFPVSRHLGSKGEDVGLCGEVRVSEDMVPGWRWSGRSLSNPLDHPVLLAQRAAVVLLDPQRHAAVVEGVVALAPDHFRETKAAEGEERKR